MKEQFKKRNETEYKGNKKLIKWLDWDWVKKVLWGKRKGELRAMEMKKKTWGDKQAMSTWKRPERGKEQRIFKKVTELSEGRSRTV